MLISYIRLGLRGDGKASNVLIHRETDDAWIIDLEADGLMVGWISH